MNNFKKNQILKLIALSISALLILSGCSTENTADESAIQSGTEDIKAPDETISIVAFGDNLMHMPVVNSGKQNDGTYDYSDIFKELQPDIKNADIAVMGQETIFGGENLGYSGYPTFNTPSDAGKTLVNEGFDVILHASNHVYDKGVRGVENTLEFWKNYPEITVLGINESEDDKQKVDIIDAKGAKLALLNYTYGTNGLTVPADKSYLVNLIDEDKIRQDVEYAEKNADFTIVFIHWGVEYVTSPTEEQKKLSELMCELGVDLVIGAHPHVIEPVEWYKNDNGNEMLVYYSLGNFVSRQMESKNLLGGMADVKLKYDGTNVKIDDYSFVPIVTHYNRAYTEFTVYKLYEYPQELGSEHGVGAVNTESWENILFDVFDGYDMDIINFN